MIPLRTYIAIAAAAAIAIGGWTARGWYEGSKQLVATEAAMETARIAMQRESDIAKTVETKLANLQANQTVIDRGVIREIQNPIYRSVCLPDAAVRLLNAAAKGAAADPADAAGQVPGSPARAH